jgi:hypothetical protein
MTAEVCRPDEEQISEEFTLPVSRADGSVDLEDLGLLDVC